MIALWLCLVALVGYLLGGFNGAILISRWIRKEDIRTKGSGNAGLTNFYRNYGGFDTLLVLLIDVGKTVLACFVGGWIIKGAGYADWYKEAQMLCGGLSVIGHIFPIYFDFRGGKGVLTCGTLAAFMGWQIIVILLAVFILVVVLSRYVSLGSVICCLIYPFLFWWLYYRTPMLVIMSVCLAALALFMHHTNIKRLIQGNENKFSFHKAKGSGQQAAENENPETDIQSCETKGSE